MRAKQRWWPTLAAVVLAGVPAVVSGTAVADTVTTDTGSSAQATTSRYMVLTGDPQQVGYRAGCTDGRSGVSGLRVLFFGGQESGGRIRPPGTTPSSPAPRVDEAAVVAAASGWVKGFTACGVGTAVVALGVNNKPDGVDGAEGGAAWARVVERAAQAAPTNRVTVGGGLDAEPGWGDPDWVRGWMDGYVATTPRMLINAGSADGCPTGDASGGGSEGGPATDPSHGVFGGPVVGPGAGLEPYTRLTGPGRSADAESGERCMNGWSVADAFHMATGAGRAVYALPQIYRTDGIQARQWAQISKWGVRNGKGPLRVAGALSQQVACRQKGGCADSDSHAGTDNTPAAAREQLTQALAGDPGTQIAAPLAASDVAWPEADPAAG